MPTAAALPERTSGCDVPAGRRALLAARGALPDSRYHRTGKTRSRRSGGCGRTARAGEFHDRLVPCAVGAGQRRSLAYLRRVGLWIQPPSRMGRSGISRLLSAGRVGFSRGHHSRHRFLWTGCHRERWLASQKAGPCAKCNGADQFLSLQTSSLLASPAAGFRKTAPPRRFRSS